MKYFPKPDELTANQLGDLYRLKRFDEWKSLMEVIELCRKQIGEQQANESLKGEPYIIFRHIGALAYTGELQEFLEAAEDYLKLLSGTGGTQNERNF
jgi:hypothetical protein